MSEIVFDDRGVIITTENYSVLLVSDLHLGYHVELSKKSGASFPSQHSYMLERIKSLVEIYKVSELFILGDVKHSITTDKPYNWCIVPEFMIDLLEFLDVTIIPGNHDGGLDPLLPRRVMITNVHGIQIETGKTTVGMIHGHAWPSSDVLDSKVIVSGHSHPAVLNPKIIRTPKKKGNKKVRFKDTIPVFLQSKLSKNCVREKIGVNIQPDDIEGLLINMPSFNPLFRGVSINRPTSSLFGPIFQNNCVNLLESEIYSIDGILLGDVESMRKRFNERVERRND